MFVGGKRAEMGLAYNNRFFSQMNEHNFCMDIKMELPAICPVGLLLISTDVTFDAFLAFCKMGENHQSGIQGEKVFLMLR